MRTERIMVASLVERTKARTRIEEKRRCMYCMSHLTSVLVVIGRQQRRDLFRDF